MRGGFETDSERDAFEAPEECAARELEEEKQAMNEYGSTDSGASLGDILGDAIKAKASIAKAKEAKAPKEEKAPKEAKAPKEEKAEKPAKAPKKAKAEATTETAPIETAE